MIFLVLTFRDEGQRSPSVTIFDVKLPVKFLALLVTFVYFFMRVPLGALGVIKIFEVYSCFLFFA